MNSNKTFLTVGLMLMAAMAVPLHAQGGCVDSPEDPTLALALVASAGALVAGFLANRRRKQ